MKTSFGMNVRDDALQFQIDHDVAKTLKVTLSDDGTTATLQMLSKAGTPLSTSQLVVDADGKKKLNDVKFEVVEGEKNPQLVFYFANGDTIVTSLSYIFDTITSEVKTETERAEAAEEANLSLIESEASRAAAAEQVNATAISDETARATAAEAANKTEYTSLIEEETAARRESITNIQTAVDNIAINLESEAATARAAEQINANNISSETTRAKAAEEANSATIEAEKTRAVDEETEIKADLDSKYNELGEKITFEETRAKEAENGLETSIETNAESIAINAEAISANTASITAESTRAIKTEGELGKELGVAAASLNTLTGQFNEFTPTVVTLSDDQEITGKKTFTTNITINASDGDTGFSVHRDETTSLSHSDENTVTKCTTHYLSDCIRHIYDVSGTSLTWYLPLTTGRFALENQVTDAVAKEKSRAEGVEAGKLDISTASTTYLAISTASDTYLTISAASDTYLTIAAATSTYDTKDEVDQKIAASKQSRFIITDLDPDTKVPALDPAKAEQGSIYLCKETSENGAEKYLQFISQKNDDDTYEWHQIGDTAISLADYRKAALQDDIDNAIKDSIKAISDDYLTSTDRTELQTNIDNVNETLSGSIDTLGKDIGKLETDKQNTITDENKLSATLVDGLATVATTGSYNDLTDKPEGLATEDYVNNHHDSTKQDVISDLDTIRTNATNAVKEETDPVFTASAAAGITADDIAAWNAKSTFSGSYNDLTDKPAIPTKTSELTNDSGFIDNTYHDSAKQDKLTAGDNITISDANVIAAKDSSKVVWDQEQASGAEIATITIDGVETVVFAPIAGEPDVNKAYVDQQDTATLNSAENYTNTQLNDYVAKEQECGDEKLKANDILTKLGGLKSTQLDALIEFAKQLTVTGE